MSVQSSAFALSNASFRSIASALPCFLFASEALPRFLPASQACGGVRFCNFLLLAGVHAQRKSKSIQFCNEFGWWTLYRHLTSNLSCYDSVSPSSKHVSHLLCVSDEPGSNGPWPNPMIQGELVF